MCSLFAYLLLLTRHKKCLPMMLQTLLGNNQCCLLLQHHMPCFDCAGAYSFQVSSPVPSRALLSAPSLRPQTAKAPELGARRLLSTSLLMRNPTLPNCLVQRPQGEPACVRAALCSDCFQKQMQDYGLDAQVYSVSTSAYSTNTGLCKCNRVELTTCCITGLFY